MLKEIVNDLCKGELTFEDGLSISNYIVSNIETIDFLNNNDCINEIIDDKNNLLFHDDIEIGMQITLDLNLNSFHKLGFYEDFSTFVKLNRNECRMEFYVHDLKFYFNKKEEKHLEFPDIFVKYVKSLEIINLLYKLAEYKLPEKILIVRENSLISMIINYTLEDLKNFMFIEDELNDFTNTLKNETLNEKKVLFINELIDFLKSIDEKKRFSFILLNFNLLYQRCNNSYYFYIQNFNYLKHKNDFDNSILELNKKIQGVINEAQNKLIAIPAATIFSFSNIDIQNIQTAKNFITVFSLFIFAYLIEIFISNQKSALILIEENIKNFKENQPISNFTNEQIIKSYKFIDDELENQKKRLCIVRYINWLIPCFLLGLILGILNFRC